MAINPRPGDSSPLGDQAGPIPARRDTHRADEAFRGLVYSPSRDPSPPPSVCDRVQLQKSFGWAGRRYTANLTGLAETYWSAYYC